MPCSADEELAPAPDGFGALRMRVTPCETRRRRVQRQSIDKARAEVRNVAGLSYHFQLSPVYFRPHPRWRASHRPAHCQYYCIRKAASIIYTLFHFSSLKHMPCAVKNWPAVWPKNSSECNEKKGIQGHIFSPDHRSHVFKSRGLAIEFGYRRILQ